MCGAEGLFERPRRRDRRRAPLIAAACAALSLAGGPASAQDQRRPLTAVEQARWRALLQQAFAQSNQGDHAVALQLALEASATQATPGVKLFLAEEHEFLSRAEGGATHLTDAERLAGECLDEATAQRSLDGRDRILRDCAAVRDRARARMVRLTVDVPSPPPGVTVRVNGEELPASAYGVEARRLPGAYVIEATAPRHGTFRHTATLGEGVAAVVAVALPAYGQTQETREQPAPPPRAPDLLPPVFAPPPEAPRDASAGAMRVAGLSLLGLGVAAGAVGVWQVVVTAQQADAVRAGTGDGAAWARYENAVNPPGASGARPLSADDVCGRASADAVADPDAAAVQNLCGANATSRALAFAFGVSGVVLAGAGVALVLLARPSARAEAPRVAVAPVFLRGGGGAAVGVTF